MNKGEVVRVNLEISDHIGLVPGLLKILEAYKDINTKVEEEGQ